MRMMLLAALVGALAVIGCGDDDDSPANAGSGDTAMEAKKQDDAMAKKQDDAMEKKGVTITLRDSDFGPMLFDSSRQAIYVFQRDSRDKTVCYGKCAEDWPPVFTDGMPAAGKGVKTSLLGTLKRRDGRIQATYAGRPLYYYAHEDPGVVLCHNVNLNGGYWWAIGADGKRRPI